MRDFLDDDVGYLEWVRSHTNGFVLNTRRAPDRNYLVLHRASCRSISGARGEGAYTCRGYRKIVAETPDELRRYAREVGREDGSFSRECGLCKPL